VTALAALSPAQVPDNVKAELLKRIKDVLEG